MGVLAKKHQYLYNTNIVQYRLVRVNKQTTINSEISFSGTGLHTGRSCRVVLSPASAHTGIVLRNLDCANPRSFRAGPEHVRATSLCTVLGDAADNSIMTVEHLLAGLFGLGIDNLLLAVDGGEIPVLDGSALPFVEKIRACGVRQLSEPRKHYGVQQALLYQQGNSRIELTPADSLSFHCRISFDNAVIGTQEVSFCYGQDDFMDICQARTFCRLADVAAMRSRGFAKGGSLQNALVVNDNEIVNPEGLRIEREFARHKLLDFLGDLSLLGRVVLGKFTLTQPGHEVNTGFVQRLCRDAATHLYELEQPSLPYYPVAVVQG